MHCVRDNDITCTRLHASIMKSTEVQPSADYVRAVPVIDGLGYWHAFTRGLPLVACGESDAG